jgi:nucleotide-binding universal stress UspA family protein
MTAQAGISMRRQSYQSGHAPKCLVIVDDSAEWDRAVRYAARWAVRGGGGVVMLRLIETGEQTQQWLGVADLMRAEAHDAANEVLDRATALAGELGAAAPDRVIREGDPTEQILETIEADTDIAMLVLAANSGAEGPGPLVVQLTKTIGAFPIPMLIVPGDLSEIDIDALS